MTLAFEINSDVASLDESSTRRLIPFRSRVRKLVDIWNSTYGIITNHSDIKIAIENDKVKIDPVSVEEMSCGQ